MNSKLSRKCLILPLHNGQRLPNRHAYRVLIDTGNRLGARRRYERAQRKAAEKRAQGIRETPSKRLLKEDVLYLMIVNMPTEAELEKARKDLQEAKEKKAASKTS